ncbi:hypothetical protein BST61_g7495 [Cercospora zeina]
MGWAADSHVSSRCKRRKWQRAPAVNGSVGRSVGQACRARAAEDDTKQPALSVGAHEGGEVGPLTHAGGGRAGRQAGKQAGNSRGELLSLSFVGDDDGTVDVGPSCPLTHTQRAPPVAAQLSIARRDSSVTSHDGTNTRRRCPLATVPHCREAIDLRSPPPPDHRARTLALT